MPLHAVQWQSEMLHNCLFRWRGLTVELILPHLALHATLLWGPCPTCCSTVQPVQSTGLPSWRVSRRACHVQSLLVALKTARWPDPRARVSRLCRVISRVMHQLSGKPRFLGFHSARFSGEPMFLGSTKHVSTCFLEPRSLGFRLKRAEWNPETWVLS